jgi:hypothetical protein
MTKEVMAADSAMSVIQVMRDRVKTKPGLFRGIFPGKSPLSRNGYLSLEDIQEGIFNLGFQKTTSRELVQALGLTVEADQTLHLGDLMQALSSESLGESLSQAEWQHAQWRSKQVSHIRRQGKHHERLPAAAITKREMELTGNKTFTDVQTSRQWWASRTHVPDGVCSPSPRRMFTAEEG